MLEVVSLGGLISRPRYMGGSWISTRCHWTRQETVGLQALCEGNIAVEKSADCLGRSPSSIAHRGLDTGLKIPADWRDLVRPKQLREGPRNLLCYPYLTAIRGEYSDLLEVNALVPRGLPSHTRADVCQEIMLALWEGRVSLCELRSDRKLLNSFIGTIRKCNFEAGGYALSLDAPMRDGRSWYDVLSAQPNP